MHRISEIDVERIGHRASLVTVTLRSPELAQTLRGSSEFLVLATSVVVSACIVGFAWEGGFGYDAHLIVIVPVLSAIVFWIAWNGNRQWQRMNRATRYELVVRLDDRVVAVPVELWRWTLPVLRLAFQFSYASSAGRRVVCRVPVSVEQVTTRMCLLREECDCFLSATSNGCRCGLP